MASPLLKYSYLEITLNLDGGALRIAAKATLDDDVQVKTYDDTPRKVFEEVLSKAAIALSGRSKSVMLAVDEDGAIVRDASFSLPACRMPIA